MNIVYESGLSDGFDITLLPSNIYRHTLHYAGQPHLIYISPTSVSLSVNIFALVNNSTYQTSIGHIIIQITFENLLDNPLKPNMTIPINNITTDKLLSTHIYLNHDQIFVIQREQHNKSVRVEIKMNNNSPIDKTNKQEFFQITNMINMDNGQYSICDSNNMIMIAKDFDDLILDLHKKSNNQTYQVRPIMNFSFVETLAISLKEIRNEINQMKQNINSLMVYCFWGDNHESADNLDEGSIGDDSVATKE